MSPLDRLAAWFVEPAAAPATPAESPPRAGTSATAEPGMRRVVEVPRRAPVDTDGSSALALGRHPASSGASEEPAQLVPRSSGSVRLRLVPPPPAERGRSGLADDATVPRQSGPAAPELGRPGAPGPEATPVEVPSARIGGVAITGARIAVVGGHQAVPLVARTLAARAARRSGDRLAVLLIWPDADTASPPGASRPAHPTARRLARTLAGCGVQAHAVGRVVHAALAPAAAEPTARGAGAQPASVVDGVLAAAGSVPVVLVLPAVRERDVAGLLPELDAVVLPHDPATLAALVRTAVAELRVAAPHAAVCAFELPGRPGPLARRATAGVAREVVG